MLLSVHHSTTYRYAEPVSRSTQYIRLTPFETARQHTIRWQVRMPRPATQMQDAFGNITHVLTLDEPHSEIHIEAGGEVEVSGTDEGEPKGRIDPMVFLRSTPLTEPDEALRDFVAPMRALARTRPMMAVTDLTNAVLERMPYQKGRTQVDFTAAQSFAAGRGVCQDHAHVFIACCRLLGIPARYVSGYVHSSNGEQVASHAWSEAWLANRWISFDISNAGAAGGSHIKVAVGLDYADACPVRGVRLGGGEEELWTTARVRAAPQR